MTEWIRPSERLPNINENVLIFERNEINIAFIKDFTYSNPSWHFYPFDSLECYAPRPEFWMPLPAPPKA